MIHCVHALTCSGCSWIQIPYPEQQSLKIDHLRKALPHLDPQRIQFQSFGESQLRSRLDFVYDRGAFGLYSHKTQKIEDLKTCQQLSPALQSYYQEFRKISWPITKGSFRLRISPTGKIGAWLDFSNLDTRNLLKSGKELLALFEIGVVEIGQRHKRLAIKKSGDLGLTDPEFEDWTETWWRDKFIPLASTVASFTQPSHISNNWITQKIAQWVKLANPHHILEFGSGFGNLTFPCLHHSEVKLTTLEFDHLSTHALKLNAQRYGIDQQLRIEQGDFRKSPLDLQPFDFILVNPARNGIGSLFDSLDSNKPSAKSIVYMSCYPESFYLDTQKLISTGYLLREIWIADQFPQTSHMELLSFWYKA